MNKKITIIISFIFVLIITGCSNNLNKNEIKENKVETINNSSIIEVRENKTQVENYVTIKYREDKVNIANFKAINSSKSSLVWWAWYDESNQYMIIDLNGVKYHYCRFPHYIWEDFSKATSFWNYYKSKIKWNYNCRLGWIPTY